MRKKSSQSGREHWGPRLQNTHGFRLAVLEERPSRTNVFCPSSNRLVAVTVRHERGRTFEYSLWVFGPDGKVILCDRGYDTRSDALATAREKYDYYWKGTNICRPNSRSKATGELET